MSAFWIAIGLALGTWANWIWIARRLRIFTQVVKNSITLPEYFEIDETTIEQWMAYQMSNDVMQGQAKLQALPDPSEKNFSLAGGDSPVGDLFYSDDESAFLPAKTRLGEISRRIAIVPMDLFGQVQSEEKIHRKTAKAVLGYSVSVPERR
jgi:hypothetical protein